MKLKDTSAIMCIMNDSFYVYFENFIDASGLYGEESGTLSFVLQSNMNY